MRGSKGNETELRLLRHIKQYKVLDMLLDMCDLKASRLCMLNFTDNNWHQVKHAERRKLVQTVQLLVRISDC